MREGAFIPLKDGYTLPKTAKQAEIRLAILLKYLMVASLGGRWGKSLGRQGLWGYLQVVFEPIPRDIANLAGIADFVI